MDLTAFSLSYNYYNYNFLLYSFNFCVNVHVLVYISDVCLDIMTALLNSRTTLLILYLLLFANCLLFGCVAFP